MADEGRSTDEARSLGTRVAGAQTISRALGVLELLREADRDVGLMEIVRAESLQTSTAHRILRALSSAGYVTQDGESGRFRLGRAAFLLGRSAERDLGFDAVAPLLEGMRAQTGESVNLVVREGDHGLVMLREESSQPLRFTQPAGTRIPLYCTSTGKVLLAFDSQTPYETAILDELEPLTESTITSARQFVAELQEIRQRGYSINRGERIEGVCGVAAPVFDLGQNLLAAIAVQVPQVRMSEERYSELGAVVVSTARSISEILPEGLKM